MKSIRLTNTGHVSLALRQYLRPQFATKRLDEVKRDDIKKLINDLIAKELSRNTIRNALCVIRGMFNQAIEAGLIEANPAARPPWPLHTHGKIG